MTEFNDFSIKEEIKNSLRDFGLKNPTEIQEKVIPVALSGRDIIGGSATGSGKTLAFGIPIVDKILNINEIQALILTPTRELTEQVSKSIEKITKNLNLNVVPVYGGVSINPQIDNLEKAHIVVGTPGRILDHLSRKTIDLSKIRFLVLDEADRMLDMGFLEDVDLIIQRCNKKRQTFLFSATISDEIVEISKKYMINPIEISVETYVDPEKLEQVYYDVPSNLKFSLLVHLLKEENSKLVIVFCNTIINADFVGKNLKKNGLDAMTLHGDLNQAKRNKILEHFHKSNKFILVCTDVAARGLDIKNVSHVYNYDCPKNKTEYVHRIGRTARAGKEGKAISIITDKDYMNFQRIVHDESIPIKNVPLPFIKRAFIDLGRDNSNKFKRFDKFNDKKFSKRKVFQK